MHPVMLGLMHSYRDRLATVAVLVALLCGLLPASQAHADAPGVPSATPATANPPAAVAAPENTSTNGGPATTTNAKPEPPAEPGLEARLDNWFAKNVLGPVAAVFFWDVIFWDNDDPDQIKFPLAVLWLVLGAVFFTFRLAFINLRGFVHAIRITRGKYDNPDDIGEVTHFQALVSALSATVGLGNIAGVAIAVGLGGPGATFWMIAAGLLGMSSKFVECTLGQKYRTVRPDGRIMGGAMYYLSNGLKEVGAAKLGAVLAGLFCILCIGGSFFGGNAFQVNQSKDAIAQVWPWLGANGWLYGLVLAVLVGFVIIGGIRRIAQTAEAIVPAMVAIYVVSCLAILLKNADEVPAAFGAIFSNAFSFKAGFAGFIGILIVGFKRAAFSNEAGVGSAAIAHAAAKTEYPVREGMVALLEPFIDTVVVCTMTALVIIVTGAWNNPAYAPLIESNQGAALTLQAMDAEWSAFPYILSIAVLLFAFSTMISWSYYGERCWAYLFGDRSSLVYRLLFCVFVFLGAILSARNVLEFGDLMILGMALPNILGLYFLVGGVARDKDTYMAKLRAGEFKTYK